MKWNLRTYYFTGSRDWRCLGYTSMTTSPLSFTRRAPMPDLWERLSGHVLSFWIFLLMMQVLLNGAICSYAAAMVSGRISTSDTRPSGLFEISEISGSWSMMRRVQYKGRTDGGQSILDSAGVMSVNRAASLGLLPFWPVGLGRSSHTGILGKDATPNNPQSGVDLNYGGQHSDIMELLWWIAQCSDEEQDQSREKETLWPNSSRVLLKASSFYLWWRFFDYSYPYEYPLLDNLLSN